MKTFATYYNLQPGTPISEVISLWQERSSKAYDRSMPVYYEPREIWPYREYTWTRERSRGGPMEVDGQYIRLEGPQKWDALVDVLQRDGWDPSEPLIFVIGHQGGAKVGEGNHRLAIAYQLGIKVPVRFLYYERAVHKSAASKVIAQKISEAYLNKEK